MMHPLHIIMPMAGEGSRFAKAGWTAPTPLVELCGVSSFQRAIASVAVEGVQMKYCVIGRQEHIDTQIRLIEPSADIFSSVLKNTRRQASLHFLHTNL